VFAWIFTSVGSCSSCTIRPESLILLKKNPPANPRIKHNSLNNNRLSEWRNLTLFINIIILPQKEFQYSKTQMKFGGGGGIPNMHLSLDFLFLAGWVGLLL